MDRHERREKRSGSAAQAAEWDARYSEGDGARWSGRPNGRLLAEVASLAPGRALDVGCGEGADAIWLARRGWTVTAIDISDVALIRAREAAELADAAVEWVRGDALHTPFPAGSFDLVSMQYPALPKAAGGAAMRSLLDTVRPGGLLLAEVASLAPGRALDVGCGEGADAIWLARRGWMVTAIDISDVAVSRAREAAERAGAVVEWVRGDALRTPFPAGSRRPTPL